MGSSSGVQIWPSGQNRLRTFTQVQPPVVWQVCDSPEWTSVQLEPPPPSSHSPLSQTWHWAATGAGALASTRTASTPRTAIEGASQPIQRTPPSAGLLDGKLRTGVRAPDRPRVRRLRASPWEPEGRGPIRRPGRTAASPTWKDRSVVPAKVALIGPPSALAAAKIDVHGLSVTGSGVSEVRSASCVGERSSPQAATSMVRASAAKATRPIVMMRLMSCSWRKSGPLRRPCGGPALRCVPMDTPETEICSIWPDEGFRAICTEADPHAHRSCVPRRGRRAWTTRESSRTDPARRYPRVRCNPCS